MSKTTWVEGGRKFLEDHGAELFKYTGEENALVYDPDRNEIRSLTDVLAEETPFANMWRTRLEDVIDAGRNQEARAQQEKMPFVPDPRAAREEQDE